MYQYRNPERPRGIRRGCHRAVCAALLAWAWGGLVTLPADAIAQQGGPPAVGVVKAERRPLTTSFDFVGRIEAISKVDLRARVTGFLEVRKFEEGREVAENDLLFLIEQAQFEAEVQRRKAELASAQAAHNLAKIQLGRAQELMASPAGRQARVDDATASERTAAAQIEVAQAALTQAEINLGYTQIRAPLAGKIGRSIFTVGAVIGPDSGTLATIVSQDPMRVAFPISVREGMIIRERLTTSGSVGELRVKVYMPDGSEYPHPGKVDFVDTQVDRNTDSVLVRATLANPALSRGGESSRMLIDGTIVTVKLEGQQPEMAVTIPRAALLADQQGPYIFIVDKEERAQIRRVKLGQGTADTVAIDSGLEEGDTVILEGLQRVRPGQPVKSSAVVPAVRQERMPK